MNKNNIDEKQESQSNKNSNSETKKSSDDIDKLDEELQDLKFDQNRKTMGDLENEQPEPEPRFSFFKKTNPIEKAQISKEEMINELENDTELSGEKLVQTKEIPKETEEQSQQNKELEKITKEIIERSKLSYSKDHIPLYKMEEMHMLSQEAGQKQAELAKKNYNPNKTESLSDFSNIMPLSKTDEPLPKFYKDLNLPPELQNFNVGNKLAAQMVSAIKKRKSFEKAMNRGLGAYIFESTKRGRLGVDLYLISFAVIGMFAIPYYYYKRERPFKKMADKNRKIIDDVVYKCENSKYDIDDISLHEDYNTLYKKEIEEYKIKKFKVKREIKKLENELYKED